MALPSKTSARARRWNPLLDLWHTVYRPGTPHNWWHRIERPVPGADRYGSFMDAYRVRSKGVSEFAFSVPTDEAIDAIVRVAPRIVELGAGTGYWAKLLWEAGADVIAYDNSEDEKNGYCEQKIGRWFQVQFGDVQDLAKHADRALLLGWPPYSAPTACDALELWSGDVLIYVGEYAGGCTANDAFFAQIDAQFDTVEDIAIPQWDGIHDYVGIYRRKGTTPRNTTGPWPRR
jgi:hypothetical protein